MNDPVHGRRQAMRRRLREWRQGLESHQDAADPGDPNWEERFARFRPPWWPENEAWPPKRRQWARGYAHRPFFRRIARLFMMVMFSGFAFVVALSILALNGLGVITVGATQAHWIAPAAGVLLAVMISAIILVGTNVRRMSMPLDDLLSASRRVAEGDYSVRVHSRGPSELRSLAAGFNSMAQQLQAHDQQRRTMLADVSHELRTPLTVIRGNVEGMLDRIYPADEAHLRAILEETQILSRLTDDLRTLSLAETGSLQLKREETDLELLARDTIRAFQSQADAGGVRIELGSELDGKGLEVDPERIRQVLGNLISNAVRYSPKGSTVAVRLSSLNGTARVAVEDSGPGIAPDALPHIFDRYYKSPDSRGMGLGLSIAKYLVEAHGGQIHAEIRPAGGTVIWFTLPR